LGYRSETSELKIRKPSPSCYEEGPYSPSTVYGALAAETSNDPPNGQLSLVLTITNNEPSPVHLNQVTVSFAGPPNVSPSSIMADLTIPSAQTRQWYFAPANNIILPVPAPGAIKLGLSCDGFSDPAEVNMSLAQYQSPATGGGYSFPAQTDDLERGEYWTGLSATHGAAGGGTQLFAYDLGVRAYDPSANQWPTSLPGADVGKNENYYVWGKPIYAMADGVVKQFKDGMPANTPPNLPMPTPDPVEGNHFYIQHGADLALYAHFQAGTLNPALTSGPNPDGTGAPVAKGQFLGLAGNSGNSSEPHLHIQVNRTTIPWGGPPRPLPFNDIHVLDLSAVDPHTWPPNNDTALHGVSTQDLPEVLSAIWPGTLHLGRKIFGTWLEGLAWAWIIIIGGLMITPGGVECIVCGPALTRVLGVVSIALGVLGLVSRARAGRAVAMQRFTRPQIDVRGDMHS
jgi:hypothetical protein